MFVHNEKEIIKKALSKLASMNKSELTECITESVNKNADMVELSKNFYHMDITQEEYIKSLCVLVIEGKY